jgi:glutamate-ammonia-ligase adenylyltransferase
MGYPDWVGFHGDLEQHRRRVQGHFDQVFAAPQTNTEAQQEAPLLDIWQGKLSAEEGAAVLAELGFGEAFRAAELLDSFRGSHACRALGGRGRERMDELMPLVLGACAATEQGEQTLARVLGLLEAVARRTAYLALLVEHPIALSQLVRLAAASPWIVERLARQPILLDELLDPRRLYTPLRREGLDQELEILLSSLDPEDVEPQMDRLRQFAHGNMLRVAAADITDVIPVMVVSDYLTWIAEAVLERVVAQAWRHLFAKYGAPSGLPAGRHGLAVIGYGKLGGIELGYGSDLDMVFLHGAGGGGSTDGQRQVADEVFYARFGQRIVHLLTTRTAAGQLYQADMRLRPNGNSGMLVSNLDAFERYQRESAWTWEHQALVRARAVAGDGETMGRFNQIRRQILAMQREPQALRQQVREMREKMRAALDESREGFFDLKQGAGGIADIEFMVQYAVLRWAFQHGELLEWSDNIRLLEVIARLGLFGEGVAETLAEAYRCFRDAYHHLVLQQRQGPVEAAGFAAERQRVIALWRRVMEADAGSQGPASGE